MMKDYNKYDLLLHMACQENTDISCIIDEMEEELAFNILKGNIREITESRLLHALAHHLNGECGIHKVLSPRQSGKTRNLVQAHIACLDAGLNTCILSPYPQGHLGSIPHVYRAGRANIRGTGPYDIIFIEDANYVKDREDLEREISWCFDVGITSSIIEIYTPRSMEDMK